jgi:hypothetical protein
MKHIGAVNVNRTRSFISFNKSPEYLGYLFGTESPDLNAAHMWVAHAAILRVDAVHLDQDQPTGHRHWRYTVGRNETHNR